MKKISRKWFSLLIVFIMIFSFTACNSDNGNDGNDNGDNGNSDLQFATVYAMAVDLGYEGTIDDLIMAFKGDSAYQIAVSKGYTGTETEWLLTLVGASGKDGKDGTNGTNGKDGKDGADGITPHIGENGNWYIGTTDTSINAGGINSNSGLTPHIGLNGNWFIGEVDTEVYAFGTNGTNGITPHIGLNGNWYIDTEDTGVKAQGDNGKDGSDGKSAFDIWKDLHGNESSTEENFLEWLKGQGGNDGQAGKSAYQIFKEQYTQYKGTEFQWITDFVLGRLLRTITFKSYGNPDITKMALYGYTFTDIPQVPEKIGNIGIWDRTHFDDITQDLTVNAIYETESLKFTLAYDGIGYSVEKGNMDINTSELYIPAEYNNLPVTTISMSAFEFLANLTRVIIPDSVTFISNSAFGYCTSLTSITIPDSVTTMSSGVFNRSGIWHNTPENSLIYADKWVVGFKGILTGELNLRTDTIGICGVILSSSASYNANITSAILPDSLKYINEAVFYGNETLTSVTIGSGLISIGMSAFDNIPNLTTINVDTANQHFSSIDGVLFNKNQTTLIQYPDGKTEASYTLPSGTIEIGLWAFSYANLTSITIPDSVDIVNQAFLGWTKAQTINILGFANETEANAVWGTDWKNYCNATIVYLG